MSAVGEREAAERKTRSLRKYEAEAIAHIADGDSPHLDLFSPFGPLIAKAEMPRALVDKINGFADGHIRERESTEFLLPHELIGDGGEASLARQTERLIGRYVRAMEGRARIGSGSRGSGSSASTPGRQVRSISIPATFQASCI